MDANPFANLMPMVIGLIAVFVAFLAINRLGLSVETSSATVSDKQYISKHETYRTTVVGNQTHVQSSESGDVYTVYLKIDDTYALAVVTEEKFNALNKGDRVRVQTTVSRLTRHVTVVQVDKI